MNDLSIGQEIFQRIYWSHGKPEIRKLIIKKRNKKTYSTNRYAVDKFDIGKKWFISEIDCLTNAKEKHMDEIEIMEADVLSFKKEVRLLNRMIESRSQIKSSENNSSARTGSKK